MTERDFFRDEERENEKTVLFAYSLLVMIVLAASDSLQQLLWSCVTLLPGIIISWGIYLKQYRNAKVRAYITTLMLLLAFVYIGMRVAHFSLLMMSFGVLVVLVALYNIPRLTGIVIIVGIGITSYHLFVRHTVPVSEPIERMMAIYQFLMVVFVGYFVWFLENRYLRMKHKMLEMTETLKQVEQDKDEYLQTIVNNVIDFSQLEAEEMTPKEERYNFNSVMRDVLDKAVAWNTEKKLDLIFDCDADIPSGMIGDAEKISRIMNCLIHNAIRYTQKGCVLVRVSVRKENYGGNLCISVSDTGTGMTPEQVEWLLAKLNGTECEERGKNSGLSIGLAITGKLVTAMRGFISVKSGLERGSEFRIVIPQKVVDTKPIAELKNKTNIRLICYMNQEKYSVNQVREYYVDAFENMGKKLEIPVVSCRSFSELKRKMERERYSHVLISWDEYREEPGYFEGLLKEMPVLLFLNREVELEKGFICIYKPFYVATVVEALNGKYKQQQPEIETTVLIEKASKEKLIDEKMGTEYCGGDPEDYREVLKVYYDYGKTAVKDMERVFEEKNWEEYTLMVHSLKSSSLGIGAESLFELVKMQEAAAREEKEAELLSNHRPMMKRYEEVLKEIADMLQEEQE